MFFLKIFKILFKTKFTFNKPEKKNFLIYDQIGSDLIRKYLPDSNYNIFSARLEKINLYCLFLSFIKYNFFSFKLMRNYTLTYIDLTRPNLIISLIDNDSFLWNVKNFFPKIKVVLIQNGIRAFRKENYKDKHFGEIIRKKNNKYIVDYIFVFNKYFEKKYKLFFDCKTKIIGSFRNNAFNYKKQRIKKNSICFISQYNKIFEKLNLEIPEKKILKFLSTYAKINKKTIYIVEKTRSNSFLEYCKKYMPYKNWKFIDLQLNDKTNFRSYQNALNCELVVTIDSTLGYELISRKQKVIFFSVRNWNEEFFSFAWPKKLEKNGVFWTNVYNENYFNKIMHNVHDMSNKNYIKVSKKTLNDYIFLNQDNKIFKQELKKITSK
ncbi:hypothetical protein N9S55_01685 [Candidatus Pelagibacter bacterium]|nr:LA_1612 family putative O-antigen biosynthesis protein [Candidatus Pelagibacter bacterium]MDA9625075.1 hypothetical protein [Candidatus Pelagibacter bacterium]